MQQRARFSLPLQVSQTWQVAYGKVEDLVGAAWMDGGQDGAPDGPRRPQIAVFASSSSDFTAHFALSPSQRFAVIGEVWLSNPDPSLPRLESESDLAWVARAWERWTDQTWVRLVGEFGLVVWDRQMGQLTLGRDRTGAKTLYYTLPDALCQSHPYHSRSHPPSPRWIAPTLAALNAHHRRTLDPIALRDYLCCAFVPGDRTLWQQVRELRPGTILCFPENQVRSYWRLAMGASRGDEAEPVGQAIAQTAQQLRHLLEQVVQDCLPTQEPVGIFLSGGLDSSSVTALAARLCPRPVQTYSIHFGPDCPNELAFSSLVAQHCATKHHILEITFRQMWEHLPETMAALDDPIGDPLTVPNLLLGRLARQSVGVVLNGEGGDPCFGGPKNQPMLLNQLYGEVHGMDPLQAYLLTFHKCAADLPQLLKPECWDAVWQEPSVFSDDLNSTANALDRLMALNIKFKGADQILTKVNNLTRATGIEGRSPLFDQRIVEFSGQIPPESKLLGAQEKAVLKQAVIDLLPAEIVFRPKSGMMVPVQLGFRKYWQREAKALLLSRQAAIAPYLNQSLIREWLNYRGDTWQRYGVKLWLLVSLEIWLQVNGK